MGVVLVGLCGATYEEMLYDYMVTYDNYYGLTEESDKTVYETTDIEENMVSLDSDSHAGRGRLADNIALFVDLLYKEEVRSLLDIQDVQDILGEFAVRILRWLWRNRPVTMKIFSELGIPQDELAVISIIWDSAERMVEKEKAYLSTDEGKAFLQDWRELQKKPALQQLRNEFITLLKADDINELFALTFSLTQESSGSEKPVLPDSITPEALISSAEEFGYSLSQQDAEALSVLLGWFISNEKFRDAMSSLIGDPLFKKVLLRLYTGQLSPSTGILHEEIAFLLGNSQVKSYLEGLAVEGLNALQTLSTREFPAANTKESNPEKETEVAP